MSFSQKLAGWRRSSTVRIGVLIVILLLLGGLFFMYEKMRIWFGILILAILGALGMEISGTDVDLGKLIETGSFKEALVTKTENGTWLIGECQKKANFNCNNFKYQDEAQALFDACGGIKNDIHGLDRDKDGIVCEANLKRPKAETSKTVEQILNFAPVQ